MILHVVSLKLLTYSLVVLVIVAAPLHTCTDLGLDIDGLRSFLESQYVPELRLLRAATRAHPDNVTVWVASDNLLAAAALEVLGSPYAYVIKSELLMRYGGGLDGMHEVLLGIGVPGEFRAAAALDLGCVYSVKFRANITVRYEVHSGPVVRDWRRYADLIMYRSLNYLLSSNVASAEELFREAMEMWDGWGFRDAAFSGVYETYKLALAIYSYRALKAAGVNVSRYEGIINKCREVISKLQRSDGGIVTGYVVKGGHVIPSGDANVETTSVVVLALMSDYPAVAGWRAASKVALSELAAASATIAALLAVAYLVKKALRS